MWKLLLLLFLVLAINLTSQQAAPRAIVHIGPHKTSSSHIQAFISEYRNTLKLENLHWMYQAFKPEDRGSVKKMAALALALRTKDDPYGSIPKMNAFLKEALAKHRNVIFSSEEFDSCGPDAIQALQQMLAGFNVTIVYVYRELLSHLVSLHFELNRLEHERAFSVPFSSYLFRTLDEVPAIVNPLPVLDWYASTFGKASIAVIDQAGLKGTGRDVTAAIVCDIAGAMCNRSDLFTQGVEWRNPSYSLVHSQVFSHYSAYLHRQNEGKCHFCDPKVFPAYQRFDGHLQADLRSGAAPTVPVLQSHLGMLVPFSEEVDTRLRTEYGDRILYGNATANQLAMRRAVKVDSLDTEAFVMSPEWYAYFAHRFQTDLRTGKQLCDCAVHHDSPAAATVPVSPKSPAAQSGNPIPVYQSQVPGAQTGWAELVTTALIAMTATVLVGAVLLVMARTVCGALQPSPKGDGMATMHVAITV